MKCPHGCPEDLAQDRVAEHVFYAHGAPPCACGCGNSVPQPRAQFASKTCVRLNRKARQDAMQRLSEIKVLLEPRPR